VPATRRSTTGDRALAVAGPRAWNNLPVGLRLSRIFPNTPDICSTYPSLQFDCIIDYFRTEPLNPRVLHIRLSKFVIIILHYITVHLQNEISLRLSQDLQYLGVQRETLPTLSAPRYIRAFGRLGSNPPPVEKSYRLHPSLIIGY